MTAAADLLTDAFTRIGDGAASVVDDLSVDDLTWRPTADANTIAWLVWHLVRVQDDHVADVAGHEQVWTREGWSERFALPFDTSATGYGQSPADVAAVSVSADLLTGYARATTQQTLSYVRDISGDDLARVVDEAWDPPVTLGARLTSVLEDDLKHLGQAEYVRGLLSTG